MLKRAGALFLSVVASAWVVAPDARAQRFSDTVDVSVVEVPVRVTDRDGNPIRGLTRENFEVRDAGDSVSIEYFEVLDLGEAPATRAVISEHPVTKRNFLILFDLTNSEYGNIDRAREAALQFVDEQISDRDVVAVATYSVEQSFRLICNFTRDKDLLHGAIDTLGNPSLFRIADPLIMAAVLSGNTGSGVAGGGAEGDGRSEAAAAIAESAEDFNRMNRNVDDSYLRSRIEVQLNTFASIARVLDRIRGQKQIILLSEGFESRLISGREEFDDQAAQEAEQALSGEAWKVDQDRRFGNTRSAQVLTDMGEVFQRSDVVLHAIDIRGLRSDVTARGGHQRSSNDALFLMTKPTGGTVFKNANDLTETFGAMLKQQEVIYLLGFRAKPGREPGSFHKLDVRLQNAGRGLNVNHRAGYYEPTPVTALEKALTASEVIVNDLPYNDIQFSMMSTAFPIPGAQRSQVPVVLEIKGDKLIEGLSDGMANAELFIYAFDESNAVADFIYETMSFDASQVSGRLAGGGVRYYGTMTLPPGHYSIKALVRVEDNGYMGFRKSDLAVPAFTGPTVLQPFLLSDAGDWVMLKGSSRSAVNAPYPFAVGEQTFIPGVKATLESGKAYQVAIAVWNVQPETMGLGAAIRGVGGSFQQNAPVRLVGRTSVGEDGGMKLLLEFTPPALVSGGQYELQISLSSAGSPLRTVSMPFIAR